MYIKRHLKSNMIGGYISLGSSYFYWITAWSNSIFSAIITKSMANGDLSSLDYDAMMSILDLNLACFYYYCLLLSV